jgi:thioredoxin-related protein
MFLTRRIVMAALLLAALAPQLSAGTWLKTVAAAQKVAKEKNQLILVDMFADWCGWCHRFEREVFPAAVFQEATSDIVLLRLDTEDGAEGTQFARKYGVTQLPTFLLLAPDLTVAGTIRGYMPPNQFVSVLKETRSSYQNFMSDLRKESSFAGDHAKRLSLAKELAARSMFDKAEPRLKALTSEKGVPAAVRDEAFFDLALGYAMQRRYDEALRTIKAMTALSRRGSHVERARMMAGQIYMQQGNVQSARAEFESFRKAFPDSPLLRDIEVLESRLGPAR